MMHRRKLLQSSFWLTFGYPIQKLSAFESAPRFISDPFAAGVASGDPTAHGVVLWTRLVPDKDRTQEWQREAVPLDWQIASDENMNHVVRSGRIIAQPEYGHSVHVEVNGLAANRWYWYRFKTGTTASEVGRTKTAPLGPTGFDLLSLPARISSTGITRRIGTWSTKTLILSSS
jgi:alkaline phosphatase D